MLSAGVALWTLALPISTHSSPLPHWATADDLLRLAIFERHVGSYFHLFAERTVTAPAKLKLHRVTDLRRNGQMANGSPALREHFSLTFTGPLERQLEQATYRFVHASIGLLDLFVVPSGLDHQHAYYQAIINRIELD